MQLKATGGNSEIKVATGPGPLGVQGREGFRVVEIILPFLDHRRVPLVHACVLTASIPLCLCDQQPDFRLTFIQYDLVLAGYVHKVSIPDKITC